MREISEARTRADQIVEEIAAECLENRIFLGTVNARAVISKHIAAALAADAKGAGPVVKPLEWRDSDGCSYAESSIGTYEVSHYGEKHRCVYVKFRGSWITTRPSDIPTAKAAAQAHKDQLVHSEIVDPPAALGAGSAPDGWQPIETAPHACHVIATRFDHDCGEWVYGVVMSPPIYPFTHWRPLPATPGEAP